MERRHARMPLLKGRHRRVLKSVMPSLLAVVEGHLESWMYALLKRT